MVGLSEVNPNVISVPVMLSMDHKLLREENELYQVHVFHLLCQSVLQAHPYFPQDIVRTFCPPKLEESEDAPPPRLDPITSYIWQQSVPSQWRNEVAINPCFFALQLLQYGHKVGQRRKQGDGHIQSPHLFLYLD